MEKIRYLKIFKERNFSAFWTGLLGFRLADILYTVGLFWWVWKTTESEALLGIVGTLNFIPMCIFGLFSGVFADLFNRKRLLVVSSLTRGFLIPLISLLHYFQILEIWHIYIIAFLQGASSTFFIVAASAIVPQLVSKDDLMAANSLVDVSSWFGNIVGFLAGGILIASLGAMNLFALTPFLLIISSLCFVLIRTTFERTDTSVSFRTVFANLADGLKIIRNDRAVFTFIVTWMGIQMFFAGGPMTIGWPVFSDTILNAGAQGYTLLIVSLSVSSLFGSIFIGQWGANKKKGRLIMLGFLWGSVGMFVFSLTSIFWIALVIVFLWNLCFPLINIPFMTLIQERVSKEELGRAFGVSNMIASAMTPISIVMTGFIMEKLSVTIPFQLFAAALGFCFLAVYFTKEARNTQ